MKMAFCAGINNYPGNESDLAGCVNDVNDWAAFFKKMGYQTKVVVDANATKAAMCQGITETLNAAAPGELAIVQYSGHGSWLPDQNGEEPDARDETLCPYDALIEDDKLLLDDELNALLVAKPKDTYVLLITDSCHSGTVYRFMPGEEVSPGKAQRKIRGLPPGNFLKDKSVLEKAAETAKTKPHWKQAPLPGVMHMGACLDTEYASDAYFNNRPNGAFTYYAIKAAQQSPPGTTYRQWFAKIRSYLPSWEYQQTPTLNGPRDLANKPVFG